MVGAEADAEISGERIQHLFLVMDQQENRLPHLRLLVLLPSTAVVTDVSSCRRPGDVREQHPIPGPKAPLLLEDIAAGRVGDRRVRLAAEVAGGDLPAGA